MIWAAVCTCSAWVLILWRHAGGVTGGFAGGEAGLQQFLEDGELKFKDPGAAGIIVKTRIVINAQLMHPLQLRPLYTRWSHDPSKCSSYKMDHSPP